MTIRSNSGTSRIISTILGQFHNLSDVQYIKKYKMFTNYCVVELTAALSSSFTATDKASTEERHSFVHKVRFT